MHVDKWYTIYEYGASHFDFEDEEFDNLTLLIAFLRQPRINTLGLEHIILFRGDLTFLINFDCQLIQYDL